MASGEFDDEAEATVSINEYIESIEADELEADLVLGGDEGDECTYAKGYMKRQAIFSCLTCTPEGSAGICTACCLSCHDGHEVLELWTKRNFKCDCGNSKFGAFACKLLPSKDAENSENSYNHNFKGLYCTCDRPYPDPNVEEQEEMIQCCICEDWFHEEHLGLNSTGDFSSQQIPRDEEGEPVYEDFICKLCSPICSFLALYPENLWVARTETTGSADACSGKTESKETCTDARPDKLENGNEPEKTVVGDSSQSNDDSKSIEGLSACVIPTDPKSCPHEFESKPLFLSKNWRDILCRCEKCLEMYSQRNIGYLLDVEDTIAEYEKRAKQKRSEKLERQEGETLDLLNNLDHVAKMEILHGIKDFKEEFRGLLETAGPSKTITPADVEKMFHNLKNKRKRME
ncbi:PREDICTED: putative E3 ubiquitin-protein ligase UBR7 isoform X2 [Tarenaya hassleriana]|uniref:putative E3 ubiquitin-protein ligase UBR7 isoform X2 n=1 Tax=Tarenaya hassleriana TaxID=28532 RepID=UPI00053C9AC4|nr:PREDICTED: putative E3 ubiquitin-protein ligase UBR7 isoform X2 [Tarenaya hassleriana]